MFALYGFVSCPLTNKQLAQLQKLRATVACLPTIREVAIFASFTGTNNEVNKVHPVVCISSRDSCAQLKVREPPKPRKRTF